MIGVEVPWAPVSSLEVDDVKWHGECDLKHTNEREESVETHFGELVTENQ